MLSWGVLGEKRVEMMWLLLGGLLWPPAPRGVAGQERSSAPRSRVAALKSLVHEYYYYYYLSQRFTALHVFEWGKKFF